VKQLLGVPSPAKINLNLHIIGQRADGYHLLESYFQLLEFGDTLDFELTSSDQITLSSNTKDIPLTENLIYRAATLLRDYRIDTSLGVHINLHKVLPMGGGLGGGSSNAATTLIALNHLWSLNITIEELCKIGLSLGADVPIFIRGFSAWVEGIGEQITPIKRDEKWYAVVHPNVHISTASIFQDPTLTRDTPSIKVSAIFEGLGHNDCEPVVRKKHPLVNTCLDFLNNFAPARMTGTGACIFAEFDDENAALKAIASLPHNATGFVSKGIFKSPLHKFFEA